MSVYVTASDIKEFKALYQKHFGIVLNDQQARSKLCDLIRQMELIYSPISEEQLLAYIESLSRGK